MRPAWFLLVLISRAEAAGPFDRVDALFARWNSEKSAGCSLGIVKNGEVLYQRGYGMANLEHTVPNGPQTAFYLGSTSKQFTAMAALLLVERGKLRLEDPIRRYLPQLPEYTQPITIRHLLEHTSGIRDYITLWNLSNPADDAVLSESYVQELIRSQKELNFKPGEEFLYSNSGYFLLSIIVRPAAFRQLAELAEEAIFQPLGLSNTHYYRNHFALLPRRATGYSPESPWRINTATLDVTGDGGVFSTVDDLVKWDRLFSDPKPPYSGAIAHMMTRVQLPGGDTAEYGRGLMLRDVGGRATVSHAGGLRGYRSDFLRIPEEKLTVICLCNTSDADPGSLTRQIAGLLLPAKPPAPPVRLTAADLKRKVGVFQDRLTGDLLQVSVEGPRLVGDFNGFRMTLAPETAMRFRGADGPLRFEVDFRNAGATDEPRFIRNESESHRAASFERVQLGTGAVPEPQQFEGDFHSEEAQAAMQVKLEGSQLQLMQGEKVLGAMQPTRPDRFHLTALNMVYARDAARSVTGFHLNTGRVRHLWFAKRKALLPTKP